MYTQKQVMPSQNNGICNDDHVLLRYNKRTLFTAVIAESHTETNLNSGRPCGTVPIIAYLQ